ncbi:MAG TPA: chemotaxis protein CheW [Devosia sp.]|jgi:purine-binding chemotaxis protein CheW|nr:chemotaxis protein CheW [Devosia sp.]
MHRDIMSGPAITAEGRAAQLRREFDQSFALPAVGGKRPTVEFISVRLGSDTLALRVGEINRLLANAVVTPVPSPIGELRGIAGIGGKLVPVYDLAALLGQPSTAGHWLVLAADRSIAFAFDQFEQHFRVDAAEIAPDPRPDRDFHIHSVARSADRTWSIIDLVSLAAAVKQRALSANLRRG